MDVRGLQISQAGDEESAGSSAPFLPRSKRALSDEIAPCGPQALAAGTVCDAGALSAGLFVGRLKIRG